MAKSKTTVTICGKEYDILSDESSEYVHRVAIYVDERIKQINKDYVSLSTSMLLTLVSLNLADDFLKTKDTYKRLDGEVRSLQGRVHEMEIELAMASERVRKLQQSEADAQSEARRLREQLDAVRSEGDHSKVTSLKTGTSKGYNK